MTNTQHAELMAELRAIRAVLERNEAKALLAAAGVDAHSAPAEPNTSAHDGERAPGEPR